MYSGRITLMVAFAIDSQAASSSHVANTIYAAVTSHSSLAQKLAGF